MTYMKRDSRFVLELSFEEATLITAPMVSVHGLHPRSLDGNLGELYGLSRQGYLYTRLDSLQSMLSYRFLDLS